jgi:hypothetical protein
MTESIELPVEILLKIFGYLSPQELLRVRQVCATYREVAQHDSLWERGGRPLFPKFSVCVTDCREEAHHWCFKQLSSCPPAAGEAVRVLEDAAGLPELVNRGERPYLLYRFQSAAGQGLRLLNLTTPAEQREYPVPMKDFDRVRHHHVGLQELFLIVNCDNSSSPFWPDQTLTFLDLNLRPNQLPQLRITEGRVSRIEVLLEGAAASRRYLWEIMVVFEGPADFAIYRFSNGTWHKSGMRRDSNTIAIHTGSGTRLIDCVGSSWTRDLALRARNWLGVGHSAEAWRVPLAQPQALISPQLASFRVKGQDYVIVHTEEEFRVIRCLAANGQGQAMQWSFTTPRGDPQRTKIQAADFGKDHILLTVQQRPTDGSGSISSRWVLMSTGEARKLVLHHIRLPSTEVNNFEAVGAVHTGEYAEYWYQQSSKELVRIELGGGRLTDSAVEEPMHREIALDATPAAIKGILVLLSLCLSARHIHSTVAELTLAGYPSWVSWAHAAVLGAVIFPLGGAVSRELQERYLSMQQQLVSLVLAGLVLFQTRSRLLGASWGWGLASLAAWNRSWPVVRGVYSR